MAVGQAPEQLEHENLVKRGEMRSLVGLGPMWETLPLCLRLERNGDQTSPLAGSLILLPPCRPPGTCRYQRITYGAEFRDGEEAECEEAGAVP